MKRGLLIAVIMLVIPSVYALELYPTEIQAKPGDRVAFRMDTNDANAAYYAGASLGMSPGFQLPGGRTVPLNLDELFFLVYTEQGRRNYFHNFNGYLDANGDGTFQVTVPGDPAFIGMEFYFAFVTVTTQGFGTISNSAKVKIVANYPNDLKKLDGLPSAFVPVAYVVDPSTNIMYIFSAFPAISNIIAFNPSNPLSMQFETLDPLPPTMTGWGTAVWEPQQGVVYIFGMPVQGQGSDSVYRFDPRAPAGQRLTLLSTRLPSASAYFAAAYDPGTRRIFVFPHGDTIRDIYEFNPADNSIHITQNSMPSLVQYSAAVHIPGENRILLCCSDVGTGIRFVQVDISARQGTLIGNVVPYRSAVSLVYDQNNRKVLVIGGFNNVAFPDIYAFDPVSNTIASAGQMPSGAYRIGSVYFRQPHNTVVTFGGMTSIGPVDNMYLIEYNPASQTYDARKPLTWVGFPYSRLYDGSVFLDPITNIVYYLGGYDFSLPGISDAVWKLDLTAPFGRYVTRAGTLPVGLQGSAFAWDSFRKVGYMIGGQTAGGSVSNAIFRFNPQGSPQVTQIATLPVAIWLSSAVYDSVGDKVYIFGGATDIYSGQTPNIWRFDPTTNQVATVAAQLPNDYRWSSKTAAYDTVLDKIYYIGSGQDQAGIVEFDPRSNPETIRVLSSPQLPRVEFYPGYWRTVGHLRSSLAYNPNRRSAYIFEGAAGGGWSTYYAIVFDMRSMSTSIVGTLPYSSSSPLRGSRHGAVYVPLVGGIIAFGEYGNVFLFR